MGVLLGVVLNVLSNITIILLRKKRTDCSSSLCYFCRVAVSVLDGEERELIALLNLSSWCLVMVERLFLAVPQGCLEFVIVVFPDHTHLLFLCVFLAMPWIDLRYGKCSKI